MAQNSNLPCDGDGVCMSCKQTPPHPETLPCRTCATPWHVSCLSDSAKPLTLNDAVTWDCPDCSFFHPSSHDLNPPPSLVPAASQDLIAAIRAIEADHSLSDLEKAKRRQELLSGKPSFTPEHQDTDQVNRRNEVLDVLDQSLNCSFCMQLPERPVTTPCGHNFCLKCFERWVGQGKRTCAKCRASIPPSMARQPRINSALVVAIRAAKMERSDASQSSSQPKVYYHIHNQDRPDKAFTTERAKKSGKANAASGKIFVTIPKDFFGPITAEHDPGRNRGVLVGDTWEDRLACRQWGVHFPHVSGIAGQSDFGAQSVALSGGYMDDEDHGEWFLYTGSGGRDLSGNKRTNNKQSFDQKFDKGNEALRVSCRKGYPVRVVRSFKEKRSAYAPPEGVRYDGIYRVEKCWRKIGLQGFKVCRYLFVRCDNDPAPWTSDDHGDRPRPFPKINELDGAIDLTERKGSPSWDFDEEKACWMWKKTPPASRKHYDGDDGEENATKGVRRQKQKGSVRKKLLNEFSCLMCRKVMVLPLTTPCAHNFCKACLEGAFAGQSTVRQRTCEGRRTLRTQKNIMRCPSCKNDITDFLQNPQVNRDMMNVIERLQQQTEEENEIEEYIDDADAEHLNSHEMEHVGSDADVIEAHGADEFDTITEDKENCDVNAAVVKEDKDDKKDGPVKAGSHTKPQQVKAKSNSNVVSVEVSLDKSPVEIADSEPSDGQEEITASVDKDRRSYKRKTVDNASGLLTLGTSIQTRSKKATNGSN